MNVTLTIILKPSLNYLNGVMTNVIILCIAFTPPHMMLEADHWLKTEW